MEWPRPPECAVGGREPYSGRGSLPPLSDLLSAVVYPGIPTDILESLRWENDVRRSNAVFLNPVLILDILLLWKEKGSYSVAEADAGGL